MHSTHVQKSMEKARQTGSYCSTIRLSESHGRYLNGANGLHLASNNPASQSNQRRYATEDLGQFHFAKHSEPSNQASSIARPTLEESRPVSSGSFPPLAKGYVSARLGTCISPIKVNRCIHLTLLLQSIKCLVMWLLQNCLANSGIVC